MRRARPSKCREIQSAKYEGEKQKRSLFPRDCFTIALSVAKILVRDAERALHVTRMRNRNDAAQIAIIDPKSDLTTGLERDPASQRSLGVARRRKARIRNGGVLDGERRIGRPRVGVATSVCGRAFHAGTPVCCDSDGCVGSRATRSRSVRVRERERGREPEREREKEINQGRIFDLRSQRKSA